ncbi:hypothetical protein D918_07698 [Trichuris suis]|nr:hypothetical protein D918_07698 [Trichuris suis]
MPALANSRAEPLVEIMTQDVVAAGSSRVRQQLMPSRNDYLLRGDQVQHTDPEASIKLCTSLKNFHAA